MVGAKTLPFMEWALACHRFHAVHRRRGAIDVLKHYPGRAPMTLEVVSTIAAVRLNRNGVTVSIR